MTYKFGKRSAKALGTVHPQLRSIIEEAIEVVDFSVLCGFRNEHDQNKAYAEGFSKLKFPKSKHNANPCYAVDIAPYPIDWNNKKRFYYLAGVVRAIAKIKGCKVRWGGDWDGDNNFDNQKFIDLPHFELLI